MPGSDDNSVVSRFGRTAAVFQALTDDPLVSEIVRLRRATNEVPEWCELFYLLIERIYELTDQFRKKQRSA